MPLPLMWICVRREKPSWQLSSRPPLKGRSFWRAWFTSTRNYTTPRRGVWLTNFFKVKNGMEAGKVIQVCESPDATVSSRGSPGILTLFSQIQIDFLQPPLPSTRYRECTRFLKAPHRAKCGDRYGPDSGGSVKSERRNEPCWKVISSTKRHG